MNPTETMVYRELESKLKNYSWLTIWLSHNYDKAYWIPILDREQAKINEIKRWARTLPWGRVRHYYLTWLRWYYQPDLRSARFELRWQFERRSMDRYHRQQERRQLAIANFKGNIPRPNISETKSFASTEKYSDEMPQL